MITKPTTIAMLYDFDKTLATKDMQEFTFIPDLDMEAAEFWRKTDKMTKEYKMDQMLAYMHSMLVEAKYKGMPITRGDFVKLGEAVEYYPGVDTWFDRINAYCAGMGINLEHYIISSGLREVIEGSAIFHRFREVYACEYLYDANNVAIWPKNVVNYTTKTQFVHRIHKGVLDLSDDDNLNRFTPEDERRIPFRNIIYVGDGLTDVPSMRLVKSEGGYAIAVYTDKSSVRELIVHGRVNFIAPADYSEGGEFETLVKDIIVKISAEDRLAVLTKVQRDMT
jgi:2-hydroxy-3-keto-5-methylthiopentenyl-1-phosphate phosphatase